MGLRNPFKEFMNDEVELYSTTKGSYNSITRDLIDSYKCRIDDVTNTLRNAEGEIVYSTRTIHLLDDKIPTNINGSDEFKVTGETEYFEIIKIVKAKKGNGETEGWVVYI